MEALGINVTSNDPVHGWESIRPTTISTEKREYLEARHESEVADRTYTFAQDDYLITRDDCKLREAQDDMIAARKRLESAWRRLEASYSRGTLVQVGAEVTS